MIITESVNIDDKIVTTLIHKLTMPFTEFDEYKQGLIDDSGNVLVKRGKKNGKHRLSRFSLLIINLKKMIKRSIPDHQLRPVALSILLLKEHCERLSDKTVIKLAANMVEDIADISYLIESEAPVNVSNPSPQPQPTNNNIQYPEPPAVKKKKKMVGYKVIEIKEWVDMEKFCEEPTLYKRGNESLLRI